MGRPPRIVGVEHLGQRRLRVTFTDGLVRELDFAGTLVGMFSSLDDDRAFGDVSVDTTAGTICWPNGGDLDPDVLHSDHEPANGRTVTVIREYRLQQAGSLSLGDRGRRGW